MSFEAAPILKDLKDFQRDTVDHVFRRLFLDEPSAQRFLVADEVGLGKTLVARGVIARAVEWLQQKRGPRPVTVVYICSSQDLAKQNIERLVLREVSSTTHATRLTLLPLKLNSEQRRTGGDAKVRARGAQGKPAVRFVSLTPGTSFDASRRWGSREERRLIYHMLRDMPGLNSRGLWRALRGTVNYENWKAYAEDPPEYHNYLARRFQKLLRQKQHKELFLSLQRLSNEGRHKRHAVSEDERARQLSAVKGLRELLARCCLDDLKPDLVILDEFQRFSELLEASETNEAAQLAQAFFNQSDDLRILLLSATPYRMYSTANESVDHYDDFLKTVGFLLGDTAALADLKADLQAYRKGLVGFGVQGGNTEVLSEVKHRIEARLRAVMCRTERVRSTTGANAMVREEIITPKLSPTDLNEFRYLEPLARKHAEETALELWKSSPYLLNFMRGYALSEALSQVNGRAAREETLLGYTRRFGAGLKTQKVCRYEIIEAGNPRLRVFIDELNEAGFFDLVWMPPSVTYWQPAGVYTGKGHLTKQLAFSAWNVVPDAVAALLSYEAERAVIARRHGGHDDVEYDKLADRYAPRLVFRMHGERPGGMSAFMLLFPSLALAQCVDPVVESGPAGELLTYDDVVARVEERLMVLLAPQNQSNDSGPEDVRWYWVTLAALERVALKEAGLERAALSWLRAQEHDYHVVPGETSGESQRTSSFGRHAMLFADTMEDLVEHDLGRVPADLVNVLAQLALAGPGACALRSLLRQSHLVGGGSHDVAAGSPHSLPRPWHFQADSFSALLSAAAKVASGLGSQFNSPRVVALLQEVEDAESYWRQVLRYCAEGNLQAVLDEYVHSCAEQVRGDAEEAVQATANAMHQALTLRAASTKPYEISVQQGRFKREDFKVGIRNHFALRYGAAHEEEKRLDRKKAVQAAFNSPFWPFVLISTSIGQEGLDFHGWCHSVIHWNLPPNPVDLEQREGRVHRYKGHAVRKNIAARYGQWLRQQKHDLGDPWAAMFSQAHADRRPGVSDLEPYWLFETRGGATVQRRIMALPLSRDAVRYERLKRSVGLYRLAFAQPRQDDLLACLEGELPEEGGALQVSDWVLNLAPPKRRGSP